VIAGRLTLVGCGNMGGAMLARWLGAGMAPAAVTVVDPGTPTVPAGVRRVSTLAEAPAAQTLVIAIKPQQLGDFAAAISGWDGEPPLIVSILAGVTASTIAERLQARRVVRAMPNLPVAIGKGVVALYAAGASDAHRAVADSLMHPLGHSEWIDDETLFDAVTALAGSGPGFLFRFIDSLASAGAAIGLPADMAARLALATVEGSALMAATADAPPAVLADRVASKGGSTREGLNVLDQDDALTRLLTATLAAAQRRNAELATLAG